MQLPEFTSKFEILNRPISEEQIRQLWNLMAYTKEENQKLNLTRIVDDEDFVEKHLLDSLACLIPGNEKTILDVGTGGGFPGLPLAILYPEKNFVLLDATAKKIASVRITAERLGLKNVTAVSGRAEELGKNQEYRESFDAVVSRAVASYNMLLELCLPFVKPGGSFYAWKGERAEEEIAESGDAAEKLGGGVPVMNRNLLLKSATFHVIIFCDKKRKTPEKYPRNFGQIKKKPLK